MTSKKTEAVEEARTDQPVTKAFAQLFASLLIGVSMLEDQLTKVVNEAIKEVEDFLKDK